MTQHILLKPVIPSPHPIFRNDPFPLPDTGISSDRALDILSKNQACDVRVLILPSHGPAIQGDEIKSEILKTLVSAGTVGKRLSENSPRVRRI